MTKKKSTATRRAEQAAAAERAAAIRREQEKKEARRRTVAVTVSIGVVLALLLGIYYAVQSSRDTTGQDAAAPSGVVEEYAVPRGKESAPVTVTVYEDFMCPFCGDFEAASADLLAGYIDSGDVQVQYRVLSFLDDTSDGSEYSTRAMNALGVVLDTAGPDVAARFHDLLFENQPAEGTSGLSDDDLVALAVEAGADEDAVDGPIRSVRFEGWVKNATDAASKDGVNSTPTVQVDGETVDFETIDDLLSGTESAIEANLAE
jgi:protein-disulfide isomerase